MKRDVLLFDLDGTLTDPKPGIVGCIRFALDQLTVACPGDDALVQYIGPPLRATFGTLLGTADAQRIEEAMAWFRQRFSETGLFENNLYDGVPPMLERTSQMAAAAYVATSKPAVYAERIVKHFGLDEHFRKVYGAELDGRFDDKAELLAHLLATERVSPDVAVMIGDRAVDMRAARANGLRAIGVLWGYGSERELVDAGADMLCRTPNDLVDLVNSS
ncbi:MAG TPA: HAD hydrolase-like protein [Pyrinomonadaceae bacterium]|nr:HAD hydrolase-like protein [Pyrinomonadaceae bacterium]